MGIGFQKRPSAPIRRPPRAPLVARPSCRNVLQHKGKHMCFLLRETEKNSKYEKQAQAAFSACFPRQQELTKVVNESSQGISTKNVLHVVILVNIRFNLEQLEYQFGRSTKQKDCNEYNRHGGCHEFLFVPKRIWKSLDASIGNSTA